MVLGVCGRSRAASFIKTEKILRTVDNVYNYFSTTTIISLSKLRFFNLYKLYNFNTLANLAQSCLRVREKQLDHES